MDIELRKANARLSADIGLNSNRISCEWNEKLFRMFGIFCKVHLNEVRNTLLIGSSFQSKVQKPFI